MTKNETFELSVQQAIEFHNKLTQKIDFTENILYSDEVNKKLEKAARDILKTQKKTKNTTKQEILGDLAKVFENISVHEALQIKALILILTSHSAPKMAPELYAERKNRRENAPTFIKRVYKDYIGTISKADIRQLDYKLYKALYRWLESNLLPDDLPLPNKSELTDMQLQVLDEIQRGGGNIVRDVSNAFDKLKQAQRYRR